MKTCKVKFDNPILLGSSIVTTVCPDCRKEMSKRRRGKKQ